MNSPTARKYLRSLVRWYLKKAGYPNYRDYSHFFEGVRIEPHPDLFSDTFNIFLHSEPLGISRSIRELPQSPDDIYIVGSGPSIKKQNLPLLRGRKIILLNGAVSLVEQYGIAPFFVVIIDSTFCIKRSGMLDAIPPGTNLLLSFSALKEMAFLKKDIVKRSNVFLALRKHDTEYAYRDPLVGMDTFARPEFGSMDGGTVMADAVRLAACLRPRNTYLLGLDIGNSQGEPRFHESKNDTVKSGLLSDYEEKILPFMRLAGRYFRENGLGLHNCSPVSKLPYDVIPYSGIMEVVK